MPDPKKNTAYIFYVSLVSTAGRPNFQVDPTIAVGDFKVSVDGSAFTNLATLPTVDPSGSVGVKIQLSASEMNGDRIMIQCLDAADNEWDDVLIYIDTTIQDIYGTVNDGSPTTTSFTTDLPSSVLNYYVDSYLLMVSGALVGTGPKKVSAYSTGKIITIKALPAAPANGDAFYLVRF